MNSFIKTTVFQERKENVSCASINSVKKSLTKFKIFNLTTLLNKLS